MTRTRKTSRRSVLWTMAGVAAGSVRVWAAPEPTLLEIGGGSLDVYFNSEELDLPQTTIIDWVKQCARTVSTYMGKFPVP